MNNLKTMTIVAGLLAVMSAMAGCGTLDDQGGVQAAQVNALLGTQAASGARADGTLYAFHFDGPMLNSTGRAKLDRMWADDDTAKPMTVYLDVIGDDTFESARHEAIGNYLHEKGVAEADLKVVAGPNPNAMHPAADNVAQMNKLNAADASAGAGAGGFASDTGTAPTSMK